MLFKGNSSRLELLINKIHINKEHSEDAITGSIGTEHGSWGSNTPEQASPAPSSCATPSSSLSDIADSEIAFTVGITETTPYACKICNKAFARSSLLSKHEQSHTDQLQYGCSYCPRLFKHKRSRDRHIKLHTGDKKYKCVHCQTAFSRSDHLKIHMKTHDNSKPFRCLICNRGYNTAAALTSHQQSHSKQNTEGGKSPGSFKCHQCPETFTRYDLLQFHTSSMHTTLGVTCASQSMASTPLQELPKWVCMYCGRDFLTIDEMQHHVNLDHSAILNGNFTNNASKPTTTSETSSPLNDKGSPIHESNSSPTYACDSCTMQFDSIEKLRVHENCIHWKPPQPLISAPALYVKDCNACLPPSERVTTDVLSASPTSQPVQSHPTDLSRKRRAGDVESPVVAKRESNDLSNHSMAGGSRDSSKKEEWSSYICSICGTQLPNFASFMVHMDIHMSVNATPTNVVLGGYCPLCGEAYRDQTELNNHIVLHTLSYKPGWCCRVCKKVFNEDLEDLQRHLVENHTCTTYRCCVCEQIFETKSAMLIHLTKKHSSECQHYRCKFCPEQIFHNQLSAEMHISQHVPRLFNPSRKSSFGSFPFRADYNTRVDRLGKNLQCPFCRQCFKGEYLHQIHMLKEHKNYRQAHTSTMTEECSIDQLATRSQREVQDNSSVLYTNSITPSDNISRYERGINENFMCDICGTTDFSSETELISHKKLHHVKSKIGPVSLQCAYCNEHCKSRSDLENHMKNHQVNSSKGKHKCNICDEIYTSAIILAEHKLSHCKIVSGNTCTQCKAILTDEQSFYSHQVQHSAVLNKPNSQISLPANCIICCQTLQTDVEIKLHSNFHLQHIIHKEFLCSMCNHIFDTRTGLPLQGYEKNSENLQIAICKECMRKCSNNGTSSSPIIQSTECVDKKVYSCGKCPKTFENEGDVKKHAVTHVVSDGATHECHICRSIFPSALKLQLHVIEHSFFGTGQFRCYICSSIFTTANGLLTHMLDHGVNSKPYECATCQMKFFFQTELDNHKYDHILVRTIHTPILMNCKSEGENASEKIKREVLNNCPYCDMLTSPTYMEIHLRCCNQNPEFKKNTDEKRKIKFAENNNASTNEEKKT
ncbi:zinc finger protein 423 homolog isoform X2 [Photinus pyralis]|uniref:C2H2-type domain-containing protein n=1 Tax=Photinus pyralis TaxID=7054 RepID=A0A1Y1MER6_PHOPY|nr:zinc finger protein 423 homolog isoform X2 [Photinus pyralis]